MVWLLRPLKRCTSATRGVFRWAGVRIRTDPLVFELPGAGSTFWTPVNSGTQRLALETTI